MYDPHAIAKLYDQTHDVCTAAGKALPRDIEATWPNTLGFLRRIPNQPYHRAAPNGVSDEPSEEAIADFMSYLRITKMRVEKLLAERS